MNLTQKVLIALVAGALLGLLINMAGLSSNAIVNDYFIEGLFTLIGKIFVNALKMLVVPLVIVSLIPGIVGIGDIKLLGRVGAKAFGLYLLTTAVAIAAAIGAALIFGIGKGMNIENADSFDGKEAPPLVEVFTGIVPSNPIAAMANGDMLAIIFFAVVFGVSLLSVAKDAPDIVRWVEQMNAVMMKMVTLVMHFAPYAVFCLMAKAMAQLGFDLLLQLIGYVLVLVGVLVLHATGTLMLLLKLLTGLSPMLFLKKIRTAQVFAFSTASSA
ncbi:MAG: dicarboxylate/amino acid:cation symporter, partial [Pontibacterium sp.]